jgi:hypothetical protein
MGSARVCSTRWCRLYDLADSRHRRYFVRRSGRWVVFKRVGGAFKKTGSVDDACPAFLAGTGVYVLDTRRP